MAEIIRPLWSFVKIDLNIQWSLFTMFTEYKHASPDGSAVWGVVVSTRWWLLVDHCVLRNWGRILVRAVKRLISRAGLDMSHYCDKETLNSNKPNQTEYKHNMLLFIFVNIIPNVL